MAALESYFQRFELWAGFIGVFADGRASLDNRLKFSPEVRNLTEEVPVSAQEGLSQLNSPQMGAPPARSFQQPAYSETEDSGFDLEKFQHYHSGPNTKQGISTVPAASAQMRPKFQTLTYQNGGGKERANGSYIMSTSKGGYSAIQGYCWLQQTLGAGILDALDEYAKSDRQSLARMLKFLYNSYALDPGNIKFLLVGRSYKDTSDAISDEVGHLIKYQVKRLATDKNLTKKNKNTLAERLLGIPSPTYLWVHLVSEHLTAINLKSAPKKVKTIIVSLPESINEAYEQILNNSEDHLIVRKALSVILGASRPLTISEINVAMNQDLLDSPLNGTLPSEASSEADYAFFNYSTHNWIPHFYEAFVKNHEFCGEHMVVLGDLGSKAYSLWYEISKYWGSFENPSLNADNDEGTLFWAAWNGYKEDVQLLLDGGADSESREDYSNYTALLEATGNGYREAARPLLDQGADLESRDVRSYTALLTASGNGHIEVVRLLLDRGADSRIKDKRGDMPLPIAERYKHEAVVRLLRSF
ncbi:hypothetical protein CIB48_g8941 [Xylaria polymorpha]|nr:hypothetical protein CIB48_g8941 [Xylaria polymorpha]